MSPVTDHAVVRWLERVQGVDLSPCPPYRTDHDRADWGCRQLGISIAQARAEIAPDRVVPFIEWGVTALRYADRTLVVAGGRVVTVLAKGC